MKKINLVNLTQDLNKLRQEQQDKIFFRDEIQALCKKIGLSRAYFDQLCKQKIFPVTRNGNKVTFEFPKSPIYKGVLEKAYESVRVRMRKKEEEKIQFLNEENAIALLKKLGYRIFKVEGIDLKKLQAERPEVFEIYKLEKEV